MSLPFDEWIQSIVPLLTSNTCNKIEASMGKLGKWESAHITAYRIGNNVIRIDVKDTSDESN